MRTPTKLSTTIKKIELVQNPLNAAIRKRQLSIKFDTLDQLNV
jgi:hypothetical protein